MNEDVIHNASERQRDESMKKTLRNMEDSNVQQSPNGHFKEKANLKACEGRDNKFNKNFLKELFQDKSFISGNLMNFK